MFASILMYTKRKREVWTCSRFVLYEVELRIFCEATVINITAVTHIETTIYCLIEENCTEGKISCGLK